MPIRILDPTVAAQIAAGEVVERPASVARELIENALDAGARRVAVDVRGGGLRELRVQDDGRGIPADEIELAFARHATSKLASPDDLWSIGTLGFRGEALPSIASVSQVVCVSRASGEEIGTELRIAGGELQARTPVGSPVGTSLSIRNLFYSTPVRREFLRSEASEAAAIAATVTQYALAYPEVRFSLQIDGRPALQTSGDGDLRAVLIELYGLEIARQLLPVELQQGENSGAIAVQGLISPPGLTRSTRNALHLFVNRRVLQPRGPLAAVVEEAYQALLMKGRHPLAVLNIAVHPATVDVNVHPTKSEVKFRDTPRVLGAVGRAIRDGLLAGGVQLWDAGPEPDEAVQRRFELRRLGSDRQGPAGLGGWYGGEAASAAGEVGPIDPQPELGFTEWHSASGDTASQAGPTAAGPSLPALRILGQAGLAYIVADTTDGIVLIDQHAAHERIEYERLQAERAAGAIAAQQLLAPLDLDLDDETRLLLLQQAGILSEWGFAIEDFGAALRVRALPAGIAPGRAAAALRAAAQAIQHGDAGQAAALDQDLLAILACHTAVRAGQALSTEEMQALVEGLGRCAAPLTCPHGRPTLIGIGAAQLERQFGRHG